MELRNTATGELVPAHYLGMNEDGNRVYLFVEGFEPTEPCETNGDGNWVEGMFESEDEDQ